jgi:hypothetical protein
MVMSAIILCGQGARWRDAEAHNQSTSVAP